MNDLQQQLQKAGTGMTAHTKYYHFETMTIKKHCQGQSSKKKSYTAKGVENTYQLRMTSVRKDFLK